MSVLLIVGLVLFLGAHSVRIFADSWRTEMIGRLGELPWKGIYSVVSILGFVLIIMGYSAARQAPVVLWFPPVGLRHFSSLLTLVAFVFLAAAYVPGNGIKARLRHPMVLAVKVWAFSHLLSNGSLADLVLFGSFLAWAILDFRSARQRDAATGAVYPEGSTGATVIAVVAGVVLWAVFAFWLHLAWIGVHPFRPA